MKAYCLHTVHYIKEGEKAVTVAKAGSIADGMPEKTFEEFAAAGAVREANPVDEAREAQAAIPSQPAVKPKAAGKGKASDGKSGVESLV